jgi:Glycosyl transferase family group 2
MTVVDTTVITPSMPSRSLLLAEAIESVGDQIVQPQAHLIRVQSPPVDVPTPVAIARQRNRLAAAVDTPWCSILDDDDAYHLHHFDAIRQAFDSDADVIYTYAAQRHVARVDVTDWPSARLVERLERANDCVPYNATIRMSALREVGGWDETSWEEITDAGGCYATGATWDDWDLWLRLARHGAKFRCVPVVTWDYRSGDWQQSSR